MHRKNVCGSYGGNGKLAIVCRQISCCYMRQNEKITLLSNEF